MSKVSEGKMGDVVKQGVEEEDDSVWESPVPVEVFTQFIGACNTREFDRALELADDILKLDPNNKIIKQYLPVLEGHRQLVEEAEEEESDDDDDEDENDDDDDDDEDSEDDLVPDGWVMDDMMKEGKDHK